MGHIRRFTAVAMSALLLSGLLVLLSSTPAEAAKVGNPGSSFTLRVQQGFLRIKDNSFDFNDETRLPQCSDGQNNDEGQDTAIDFPADPQCTSALDDSEVQGGFQAKLPIQLTNGTIAANGNVTFPASGVSFPTQYMYAADVPIVGSFVVTINMLATHDATGVLDANTGTMSLRLRARVTASGGQLNSGCQIGTTSDPIDLNMMITGVTAPPGPNTPVSGVPYNPATGRVTLVNNSFSVPGASGCTATFLNVNVNGEINSQLGLPSAAGNNEALFLGEFIGTRPQPAITASFTATPNNGPAPLAVSFNAGASTGSGLTYQWDFTNNGSFDASGVTTSFVYPTAGAQTARLRVTDSGGDFVETTRLITVGANLPPTANDQTVTTPEDQAIGVTLTGSDPAGETLTYSLVPPNPANGTVTGTPPNVTYTPNANFNGTNSFGFRVTDPFGNTDDGVVTVNVTPVNDAPTASNVTASVVEDGSTTVTLVGNDIDGDPLDYVVVTPPANGSLTGSGSTRTYAPNADFNGVDTFTYRAVDPGGLESNVATATITVTPVNDAPVATPQSVTTPEDTPVPVVLAGTDVDGDPLVFSIGAPPSHGTLSGVLPNLTYTPAANYHGTDSFTFRAADPSGAQSTLATVSLTVTPVNDAPTAANANVGTQEDTSIDVTIVANDVDGDALTYTPASPSTEGGTISCAGAVCTYTPASGFSGTDTFTVEVSDGELAATATVTVNVSALNNTDPVINDSTIVVLEDTTRTFQLASADADGDPRTYLVLVDPATGALSCTSAGLCTYVPEADANGSVTFVVQVSDGRGGIDSATITLAIVPINDPPVVPAQSVTTAEDTTAGFDLVGSDVDGDVLTWTVKRDPAKGALSCTSAGACTYAPSADVHGSDSFEVEADDGKGARVRITVPVTITPVNDPPTAGTVPVAVWEDASAAFALVGADVDGDALTFTADDGTLGSLSCTPAGACTYTPGPDANGTEAIAYTVSDGSSSTTGVVVVTIVPINDPPVAISQSTSTDEDVPVAITLAASDPDPGDVLTYTITSAPGQGTLSGIAPALTYTPAPNASGTVSFGFRVTDAAGASSTGTITIVVNPVDDLPVAHGQSVTTPEDTPKAIVLSGSDVEGPVTIAVTSPPSHGTYSGGVYVPAANYHGADSIGFSATDGTGNVAHGTVSITVTPVNDPPVASDLSVSTTRTVPVAVTLAGTDVDGDALSYTVLNGPTKGTLSGTAPNLTYTPTGLNTGTDAFTFRVTDAAGAIDSGTVQITIAQGGPLATTVTVAPATVTKPSGLLALLTPVKYNNLKATLTAGGVPIAGVTVQFVAHTSQVCTATTNAAGVATCSGNGQLLAGAATTYQASFAGNASFAASTGTGPLS